MTFYEAFTDELDKVAGLFSSAKGKQYAEDLNKHIQDAGGDVKAGVASYNKAKKAKPMKKLAARGDQSAKLLSLLKIKGANPYTYQAVRAVAKAKKPGGLPRGTSEAREAAKTIRAMKKRTDVRPPGRYEQALDRQLNLPTSMKSKFRRVIT